jgi:hypothetical protein
MELKSSRTTPTLGTFLIAFTFAARLPALMMAEFAIWISAP